MKRTRFLLWFILILAAGCAGNDPYNQPTLKPGQIAPPPSGGEINEIHVIKAREMLAAAFQRPVSEIAFIEARPQTWPDGCLGLAEPEEICTEAEVPGYLVVLAINEQRYAIRTDEEGDVLRSESALPEGKIENQAIADLVISQLAAQLEVGVNEVKILEVRSREWTNGCLEVVTPGSMCPEVMVPGYQVFAEVQGVMYEMHTNLDGAQIIQAKPPK